MTEPDARVDDDRLSDALDLLARLAAGDFSVQDRPAEPTDDAAAALLTGIRMLAEDLEAHEAELTERVRQRTHDLEQINRDVVQLVDLGNVLQRATAPKQVFAAASAAAARVFSDLTGAVYTYRADGERLELRAQWGPGAPVPGLLPHQCAALQQPVPTHSDDGDATPVRNHSHGVGADGSGICLPITSSDEFIGIVRLVAPAPMEGGHHGAAPPPAKVQIAQAMAEQIGLSLTNLQLRAALQEAALRDSLTGLFNRRVVEEWARREMTRAQREGTSLGLLMIDVDNFKAFNDIHGHDAGDAALRAVAAVMQQAVRGGDLACRYGGEEFLLLLTNIDSPNLLSRAEEMRRSVELARLEHLGVSLPAITVSIGAAIYPDHGELLEETLRAADKALYAAKADGRNRVVSAASTMCRH